MNHSFKGCLKIMLFNISNIKKNLIKNVNHLNSTLHMWNFIPKFDDNILVYLWLLTRRLNNNVHSLESFSLVEPIGTRLMNYFMQMRWGKQINGSMSNRGFHLMEMKLKRIFIFIPMVVLEPIILFRG